jgi:hypothetical protein
MLQTRIRSVSGNLMDICMEVPSLNMAWDDLDADLKETPKFKPGMLRVQQDAAMKVWGRHGCLFCTDILLSKPDRQECVRYDRCENGPQCVHALTRQLQCAMSVKLKSLPLFLMLLGRDGQVPDMAHALCVIVHFTVSPTRVASIDWLNTWNHGRERANEVAMTLLAITLSHVVEREQDAGDIMARIRLPLKGEYNLQEGELTGLCQSWDSYFIYKILAQGVRPARLFQCLRRADQKRRRQRVINFTNSLWAAFERRFKK